MIPLRRRCSFGSTLRAAAGILIVAIALALAPAGCSREPKIARVNGKVTYRGQLVTTGTITFYPESGRPAIGQIGPDGTFKLTTHTDGDGAFVGNHRVTIHATKVGAGSIVEAKSFDEESKLARSEKTLVAGKIEWLVPEKYSREETSTLTAAVKAGSNTIDFEIPNEP
jgi:hypothetical protein